MKIKVVFARKGSQLFGIPHSVKPSKDKVRVVIAYKNFAAYKGISHIGLGVTAMTNAKVLREKGYWVDVWPVVNNVDIVNNIKKIKESGGVPLSHVIISAPWLSTYDLATMVHAFPDIHFAVISHSNFGFLQADPNGIRLLREASELSLGAPNFSVGGNSYKFVRAWEQIFGRSAVYLPNMYHIGKDDVPAKRYNGGTMRIGSFGAVRPLKNTITSAAAALQIAKHYHADLEFWVSGGRAEGGGDLVLRAINQMYLNLPNAKVVQAPWRPWPGFREIVRNMDLMLQMSYTESFNMVTADGVAEGVCSVTSDAIEWVPDSWKAKHDDVAEVAETGMRLLNSSRWNAWRGMRALKAHNDESLGAWEKYLMHKK